VLVDVGGVAYELDVPMSTFYALPANGETVSLLTHLVVREDAHNLYGFATGEERSAFRQLIRISGVGARTALAVLSGMSVGELAQCVALQDAGRLTRIPGIGKKTAERMVLELRDKLAAPVSGEMATAPPVSSIEEDVLSALMNLGYQRPAAERALASANKTGSFESIFRSAMAALSK
jgi:holliday junction DNA helicase RuvA